jgi:membrane-associated phospholipid phosphatase
VVDLALVVVCFSLVSYGFTVVKALLFTAQPAADASMVRIEAAVFGSPPHRAVATWAAAHPGWVRVLDDVYFRLFDHMVVASVFLLAAGRIAERWRLLAALAWCYMLGSVAYHAWPGVGPAFFDPAAYAFLGEQGGLHTTVIQKLLTHNTGAVADGRAFRLESYAYIACMPSLHIAHELVMLWYARSSRLFLALSAVFSVLTVVSTVVLGWHYPIDALGGGLLAATAIWLARATVRGEPDAPFG